MEGDQLHSGVNYRNIFSLLMAVMFFILDAADPLGTGFLLR